MQEEHQIAQSKALAHFLNEWRVIAVRQKDLRDSASAIAQQWEREITLKRKLAISPPFEFGTQSSPSSIVTAKGSQRGPLPGGSTNSPDKSTKAMWSDMKVLSNRQQHPAELVFFDRSKHGANDPQLLGFEYSRGVKELDVKAAFRIWQQILRKSHKVSQKQTFDVQNYSLSRSDVHNLTGPAGAEEDPESPRKKQALLKSAASTTSKPPFPISVGILHGQAKQAKMSS